MLEIPANSVMGAPSPLNNKDEQTTAEATIEGLTLADTDIDTKANITKSLDMSASEAAIMLMSEKGGGHSAAEVSNALVNAGYDEQKVDFIIPRQCGKKARK